MGLFYVACWPKIKKDLMEVFMALLDGFLRISIHQPKTHLIPPKKSDALAVHDLRSMSLIHSMQKLLAKEIATRLVKDCGRAQKCLHKRALLV